MKKRSKPAKKKTGSPVRKKSARKMPVFSKPSAETVAAFERAVSNRADVERRTMFGYPSVFLGGNMLSCVFQDRIMVRLSPADREAAMAIDGARPFEPSPGRAMKEYIDFPRSVIDHEVALREWVDRGARYVMSLPPKKAKRR
ncbi:MAG TPA: TfoX/Sxy family protein [Gemmatimonadaceae bacterium]|nr:TfoX/Sxy family protein [Gemmatimonadaceae bacterium]